MACDSGPHSTHACRGHPRRHRAAASTTRWSCRPDPRCNASSSIDAAGPAAPSSARRCSDRSKAGTTPVGEPSRDLQSHDPSPPNPSLGAARCSRFAKRGATVGAGESDLSQPARCTIGGERRLGVVRQDPRCSTGCLTLQWASIRGYVEIAKSTRPGSPGSPRTAAFRKSNDCRPFHPDPTKTGACYTSEHAPVGEGR